MRGGRGDCSRMSDMTVRKEGPGAFSDQSWSHVSYVTILALALRGRGSVPVAEEEGGADEGQAVHLGELLSIIMTWAVGKRAAMHLKNRA